MWLLLLGGCRFDDEAEPADERTWSASLGCDPMVAGQEQFRTTTHEGIERTWLLRLPTDWDCSPRDVVFGLHGLGSRGRGLLLYKMLIEEELDRRGLIGVFPDGLGQPDQPETTSFNDLGSRRDVGPDGPICEDDAVDYGVFADCPDWEHERQCRYGTPCVDDVGFFRAILDELAPVTRDVHVMGFSRGAQTASSLACKLGPRVASITAAHGFASNGFACAPEEPVTFVQIWGTSDRIMPASGLPGDGFVHDGAEETLALWAEAQDCGPAESVATEADGVRGWGCVEHVGCSSGARVVDCSWDGAHDWPQLRPTKTSELDPFGFDAIWPLIAR